jgi:hypothetical protein
LKKSSVFKLDLKKKIFILFLLIIVIGTAFIIAQKLNIFAEGATPYCKYLISYGVSNNGAYPSYIRDNLATIENLPNFPYDGVGIQTSGGTSPMYGITQGTINWTYAQVKSYYQPLFDLAATGQKPTKLKHNFLMAHLQDMGGLYTPGDATDKAARDAKWANTANNLAQLAKVAVDLNNAGFPIDGIFFDNEGPYRDNAWSNPPFYWVCGMAASGVGQTYSYSPGCSRTNAATLLAYQDQSRARGQQVMNAIKTAIGSTNYSKFKFMFMHSTDESCSQKPSVSSPVSISKHWNQYLSDLQGSFELGLAESASGTGLKVIDGGEESYGYRLSGDFTTNYGFRHNDEATIIDPNTSQRACLWIPTADQSNWSDLLDTAFAMYNKDYPAQGIPGQTVDTIGPSTKLALENSDNYVWFYVEGVTTIGYTGSTQIGQAWTDNIKAARDVVVNDPSCESGIPPSELPDLAITNVTFSPTTPHVNDEVSFSVDIKNQGTAATPTGSGIFLGAGFQIDGTWVTWNDTYTASLAPGATITLTPSRQDGGKTTWTATQGSHTLTTIVDNANKITESNESNNQDTRTINVDIPGPTLNLQIQLQGRTDYTTTGTTLKIYDSSSTLVFDRSDIATDASGNAQITLPTSMTVGQIYSFFTKPGYFLGDYKASQTLTNPMSLTYAEFKGGDFTDDNMINTLDFSILSSRWMQSDPIADINQDSIVNTIDFAILSANWLIGT